mmetsp:Transcript_27841/g.45928  ORF Transcript_27841/g.45928 Transcript_27841/m.45928 type:complete len:205 (-) Transcript_27841:463-1077(-)
MHSFRKTANHRRGVSPVQIDRCSLTIDDMLNPSATCDEHCQYIGELHAIFDWCRDSMMNSHILITKKTVHAHSIALERVDAGIHLKRAISLIAITFLSAIIWKFRLIKIRATIVSIPLYQIPQCMLDFERVRHDIIAVDYETSQTWVLTVIHWSTRHIMIRPPQPTVVEYNIITIDAYNHISLPLLYARIVGSAYARKYIVQEV